MKEERKDRQTTDRRKTRQTDLGEGWGVGGEGGEGGEGSEKRKGNTKGRKVRK